MDDLTAFLRARLDEDEQVALDWQRHKQVLTERFMNDPHRKDVRVRREPVTDAQVSEYAYRDRFDPARTLREVAAKRRLIERYENAVAVHTASTSFVRGQDDGYRQACLDAIRDAAELYADHEDYRDLAERQRAGG